MEAVLASDKDSSNLTPHSSLLAAAKTRGSTQDLQLSWQKLGIPHKEQ